MDTVSADGSTIHTAGCPLNFVSAVAGISITGTDSISIRPITVAPSSIAGGGSVKPTLTSKVRVTGLACGATSRTRPRAVTAGSLVRLTVTCGSGGAERINWAGTSNTASRPSL